MRALEATIAATGVAITLDHLTNVHPPTPHHTILPTTVKENQLPLSSSAGRESELPSAGRESDLAVL